MATTATQRVENPKKTLVRQQPSQPSDPNATARAEDHHPPNTTASSVPKPASTGEVEATHKDGGGGYESKAAPGATAAPNSSNSVDAPVSNVQKKILRAERFGVPVQLSEEEKRNSRAERFGLGSAMPGSVALKTSEEQKRKARAERFGLVQSVPVDEEAKKKARLTRFGQVSGTDSVEDDKKKARAIRFSQPLSNSVSQVNDKGDIEQKTAIAGKAGGGA